MTAHDRVDLVSGVQLGQEDLVELLPDPGGLPVAKPSPAGHAAAAAHLQRQVLPRDASLEDEEDAGRRPLRLSRGLRPGNRNRRGLGGGSNGSIRSQSSSGSKGLAMGAILPSDAHFYVEEVPKFVILLGSLRMDRVAPSQKPAARRPIPWPSLPNLPGWANRTGRKITGVIRPLENGDRLIQRVRAAVRSRQGGSHDRTD